MDGAETSSGIDLRTLAESNSKTINAKVELNAENDTAKVTADLELTNLQSSDQSKLAGKNVKVTILSTGGNCKLVTED